MTGMNPHRNEVHQRILHSFSSSLNYHASCLSKSSTRVSSHRKQSSAKEHRLQNVLSVGRRALQRRDPPAFFSFRKGRERWAFAPNRCCPIPTVKLFFFGGSLQHRERKIDVVCCPLINIVSNIVDIHFAPVGIDATRFEYWLINH